MQPAPSDTPSRTLPYLLIAVQLAAVVYLLLTGPWVARHPGWLALEGLGFALGLWAIATMRIGNFNIIHLPRSDGRLVTSGPYRWVRHPMYTALLMGAGALVGDHFSPVRLGVLLLLAADLLVKMHHEEQMLQAHFAGYADYQQHVRRLVPWIY